MDFKMKNGILKDCAADAVTVTLPSEVTTILEAAFIDCSLLTSVIIPATVAKIESGAFLGCESLRSVTVDQDNPVYCDVDGILYSKDKSVLLCYPAGRTEREFTVPDGVKIIADSAFACCKNLRKITLPDSVEVMEDYAFLRCENLSDVTFSGGKITARKSAFEGCRKFREEC